MARTPLPLVIDERTLASVAGSRRGSPLPRTSLAGRKRGQPRLHRLARSLVAGQVLHHEDRVARVVEADEVAGLLHDEDAEAAGAGFGGASRAGVLERADLVGAGEELP